MNFLHFESLPSVTSAYRRALVPRRRTGFAGTNTVPRIQARVPSVTIDRARLSAYRHVCSLPDDGRVPVTFTQVMVSGLYGEILVSPHFPASALGVVHVRNRITARRPIVPQESLELMAWTEGHRVVERGIEVDLHATVSASDEHAWESSMTVLIPERSKKRRVVKHPAPVLGVNPAVRRSVSWKLSADLGRRYAAVSGDYNPIHLHPLTSKLFGFRRPIAHGLWSLARVLGELDDHRPACPFTYEANFERPIPLPATAVFSSRSEGEQTSFRVHNADGSRTYISGRCFSLES